LLVISIECNKFLLGCWSSGMICFVVGSLLYPDISKQCNTFVIKTDRRQVGRLLLIYGGYLYRTYEARSVREAGIWYFSVICYPIFFSLKGYMFEFEC